MLLPGMFGINLPRSRCAAYSCVIWRHSIATPVHQLTIILPVLIRACRRWQYSVSFPRSWGSWFCNKPSNRCRARFADWKCRPGGSCGNLKWHRRVCTFAHFTHRFNEPGYVESGNMDATPSRSRENDPTVHFHAAAISSESLPVAGRAVPSYVDLPNGGLTKQKIDYPMAEGCSYLSM